MPFLLSLLLTIIAPGDKTFNLGLKTATLFQLYCGYHHIT